MNRVVIAVILAHEPRTFCASGPGSGDDKSGMSLSLSSRNITKWGDRGVICPAVGSVRDEQNEDPGSSCREVDAAAEV